MQQQRLFLMFVCILSGIFFARSVAAQVNEVTLTIDPGSVGLNGAVMAGQWTPMRLLLNNQSADVVSADCRWLLRDLDGDRVIAERSVTLNPLTPTVVWLYAPLSSTHDKHDIWTVQVVESQSREIIASRQVKPTEVVKPGNATIIGVLGGQTMKLRDFNPDAIGPVTGHEPLLLMSNLGLSTLPDRWYGMSMLRTLVWTPLGGDPGSMPASVQQALRQWVKRGGHLVIVMPHVGEPWTGSPLSDLLPITPDDIRRRENFDLLRLGTVKTTDVPNVPYVVFDTKPPKSHTLIAENADGSGDALVATSRYGFGNVTLVGINLASPAVAGLDLPNGRTRIWHEILHVSRPLFPPDYLKNQINQGALSSVTQRDPHELGFFVPNEISMTGTAALPLLLSIMVFGVYWLIAGPITFGVLKARKLDQYNWLAFVACVLVFSIIAWSMAWVMRPHSLRVEHVSILDIDGNTNTVRTQAWFSVLIPEFGTVDVAVAPTQEKNTNTLANMGTGFEGMESAAFIDPQTYRFDAAYPSVMSVPARATAKSFNANYLGPLIAGMPGLEGTWTLPQMTNFEVVNSFPQGTLVHNLPGELRDVLIVYAPGNGNTPWVWRTGNWKPGQPLDMTTKGKTVDWLFERLPYYKEQREWKKERFLGNHMGAGLGRSNSVGSAPSLVGNDQVVRDLEALTFFDALPPPNFRDVGFMSNSLGVKAFKRPLGHQTDLTPLIGGRRLIILGHLDNSQMPLPLTVDEQSVVDQTGRTFVRYIYDF